MNILITMAGRGQRFIDAGYTVPKWRIEINNISLLEWSIDSLPLSLTTKLIFVCLKEHVENYNLKEFINLKYKTKVPKIEFVELDHVTRGQAESALIAQPLLDMQKPLLIFNIDTQFVSNTIVENLLKDPEGLLGAFTSNSLNFSYAALDGNNEYVVKTAEKEVISDYALTGLYYFKHPTDFIEATNYAIQNNITVNNEFYIAPIYNYLIAKGNKVIIDIVDEINILGTPSEVDLFKSKIQ